MSNHCQLISTLIICMFSLHTLQAKNQEEVFMSIDESKVSLSEFENIFKKNNRDQQVTDSALNEYVELFTNFKLKVKEAEDLGMDTNEAFVNELAGYRQQLALPYLTDKELSENLVKEAYQRLKHDIRARHILLKVSPTATPKDTLAAYQRIIELRKRIIKEDNFEELAATLSDDVELRKRGGDLGYFSAFRMVYPFESAAYNTPVGEVSRPVRTSFGYHLLKVEDKRASYGKIQVAQILIRVRKGTSPEQEARLKQRADELYEKAKAGDSFEQLVSYYSEDRDNRRNGGLLKPFGPGEMAKPFEEAAYALENDGDISQPVRTSIGFHIIKRIHRDELKSFEEMEAEIKRKVQRDRRRMGVSRTAIVEKLKKEYDHRVNQKAKNEFYTLIDENYFKGIWPEERYGQLNKSILTIKDEKYSNKEVTYTQKDFALYLKRRGRGLKPQNSQIYVDRRFNEFVQRAFIDHEESILELKYPEFKALMQEYRDGILLFDLMDDKVWTKAIQDSIGLEAYHQNHAGDFMWGERYQGVLYASPSESMAAKARKLVKKGKLSTDEIMAQINEDSQLNLTAEEGVFLLEDYPVFAKFNIAKGTSTVIGEEGKFFFAKITQKLSPAPKELNEARGLVTAAYQKHLEEEWIKELRTKYRVTINRDLLERIK